MKNNLFTRLLALVLVLTLLVWNCKSDTEQPKPTATNGSTGVNTGSPNGGSTAQTGTATFFTKEDLGVGAVTVYVDGTLAGTISHYHAGGVTCGQGDVNVTKAGGTYAYKAIGGNLIWEGTVVIKNGVCLAQELAKGTSAGSTTAQGQVTFWTAQTSGWSSIDVSVGGTYAGSITKSYGSAPSCGASGCVIITKMPGTYAFTAKSKEGQEWSGNVTVTANGCATNQLTFAPNSGGNSSTTCDWAYYEKLVTVTKWAHNYNFCDKNEGQTLVSVRNDANVNMDVKFCMLKADGTWKELIGLDTKPGGWLIGPDSWTCGKAKGYKIYARPHSKRAECVYPVCN